MLEDQNNIKVYRTANGQVERFHSTLTEILICLNAEKLYNSFNEMFTNTTNDFNAKVGREGILGPTLEKHCLHEKTSDNGFRLVSFAAAQNMVISSSRFQHLNTEGNLAIP